MRRSAPRPTRRPPGTVIVLVTRADEDNENIARALKHRGYQLQACDLSTAAVGRELNAVRDLQSVLSQLSHGASELTLSLIGDSRQVTTPRSEGILVSDNLTINRGRREVRVGDDLVELTKTEFDFLYLMASEPGIVFTRNEIVDACKGVGHPVTMRSVDVQVVALRRKLGPAGKRLQTIRGVGYRWVGKEKL